MNGILFPLCLGGLAVLPVALLGLRAARPKLMPWWAVFALMVGLGWGLVLAGAMLRETTGGGAGHVMALFLGWAYALIWFAPWLLFYALIQFIRGCRAKRRA